MYKILKSNLNKNFKLQKLIKNINFHAKKILLKNNIKLKKKKKTSLALYKMHLHTILNLMILKDIFRKLLKSISEPIHG